MRNFRSGQYRMKRLVKSLYQLGVISVAVLGCGGLFLMNPALANPVVNNVAGGSATIQQNGNTETINQGSQKAIINWNSFNIGKSETTQFIQPTGGIALNRINPANGVSQIYGKLTATGQIILINGAGIYFGPSAYVNVGGLIASTEDISNQNFWNGNYSFTSIPGYSGSIINEGSIIAADNGLIALVGRSVENTGLIQADLGNVVLASGDAFTISFDGNDLINFVINTPTSQRGIDENGNPLPNGVTNLGTIAANGGKVLITAQAAAGVLDNVIDMQGIVQAQSVSSYNGEIILSGDPNSGEVHVGGTLDASGTGAGQTGGTVQITGYNILLDSPSVINVSGDAGGGTVSIGGSLHGQGPLPDSNAVVMEPGAEILASALTTGNGGNVTLWSNDYTGAYGSISAMGGALNGNGGNVDTSSANVLDIGGLLVNTGAPNGTVGNWLLDPYNVTICSGAGGCSTTTPSGLPFFTPESTSMVSDSNIITNLGSTNVTISTGSGGTDTGNINVNNNVNIVWAGNNSLTLDAYDGIDFVANGGGTAASIINTSSNSAGLTLEAGTGNILLNNALLEMSGPITMIAPGNTVDLSHATLELGSGGLTATDVGQIDLPASLATNNGPIDLGPVILEQNSSISTAETSLSAGGLITLGSIGSTGGSWTLTLGSGQSNITLGGEVEGLSGILVEGSGIVNMSQAGTVDLGAGGLSASGSTTGVNLPATLITDSGPIDVGPTVIMQNSTIDTTDGGASSGANVTLGSVEFGTGSQGSINTTGNFNLGVNSGTGNVTLYGSAQGLSQLSIQSSGTVNLYPSGSVSVGSGGLIITDATQILLPGTITTDSGPVELEATQLLENSSIDTTNGGEYSGASVTFQDSLESGGAPGYALTLLTGNGGATFDGSVQLQGLDIQGSGIVNMSQAGTVLLDAGGLTLNNSSEIIELPASLITNSGPVALHTALLEQNSTIDTTDNGSSGGAAITLGSLGTSSNSALTISNGTGNVTINSSVDGLEGITIQGTGIVDMSNAGTVGLESGGLSIPNASAIYLPASITTSSGPIDLGTALVEQNTTIDTTNGGGYSNGANITLGTVNATDSWSLTLNQGNTGNLTLNGDVYLGPMGALLSQGSGTTIINTNQLTSSTQFFVGPVVLTASSLEDDAIIGTFESSLSGPNTALTFGGSGDNIELYHGATLASLYSIPEITIVNGSITTSGSQTYESNVTINASNVNMAAGGGISLLGGISGAGDALNVISGGNINITNGNVYLNNLNLMGSGNINITDNLYLHNLTITGGGTAVNNTLSLGIPNALDQVWNITGQNTGNITGISNVTGQITFNNIGNLTSYAATNDFIFTNSAILAGSLYGASDLGATGIIDYSNYGTPVTTTLNSISTGTTANDANTLNTFSGINQLIGTGSTSILSVPSSLTVNPTSSTSGTISDPLTYSGYTVSQPSPTPTPTPTPSNNTNSTAAQQSAAVAANTQSNSTGSSNANTETNSSGEVLWVVNINGTSQNINQIIQDFSTQYEQTLQKVVVSPICFQSGQG